MSNVKSAPIPGWQAEWEKRPSGLVEPRYSSPLETADGRVLPTRGDYVCDWIETHCVCGEGDWYGEPAVLRPFQQRFIYRLYEYYPESGQRRYRRGLLGMGKGNGKTPIAAWIGAYELFDEGRRSPRVIIGGASLKQGNLVFGDLRTCATESPTLSPLALPYDLEIRLRKRAGVAERIAAEAGTNDGARATVFIADELQEWIGRTGRVFMIVDGAVMKRRDAFTLGISTAGVDRQSVLHQLYTYGVKVAKGDIVDDGLLFEWYEADDALDLSDPTQWVEAVRQANPAVGDFLPIANVRERFDGSQAIPEHEFRRYHLNQWAATGGAFIRPEVWAGLAEYQRGTGFLTTEMPPVPDGTVVALGFDGSYNDDSTALVGRTIEARPHIFVVGAWEKPERESNWVVPRSEVDAAVHESFRRWRVKRLAGDPAGWYREMDEWIERYGDEVVVHRPTNRQFMAQACADFYAAVIQGAISHDGDPRLARHMENARVKETSEGAFITKEGRGSPHKIDLAVAAILANDAGLRAGQPKEPMIAWL